MVSLGDLGVDARPFAGNEVGEYRASEIGVSGLMVTPEPLHIQTDGRILDALLPALREPEMLLLMLKNLPVRDPAMQQLAQLPNLIGLNVFGTQVTETGLSELEQLPNLRNIELPTHASDETLRSLARGQSVRGVFAPDNERITDRGLRELEPLEIEILHLPRTQIGDAGLAALRGQEDLRLLNLESTRITDSGLAHMQALTRLRQLNVRGTAISAAALGQLRTALPNCQIDSQPSSPLD